MSYWTLVLEDGSELPLDGSAGLALRHISGHGMPPITTISSEYALRDGALYQRQKTQPRTVQMLIVATDAQECGLRASRERLLTAINPHRLHLPITLCYYDGKGDRRSLCCYYDGGMDGDWEAPYNTEEIVLRLIAFQPYWSGPAAITDTLDVYDSMASPNFIIERDTNGHWSNMHAGADNSVNAILVCSNGDVYAGGSFHNIGAVACAHIARWDVATQHWIAMGLGVDDVVTSLAMAPNGDLYVGGAFHNAGGGAALHIAKWKNSTTTWSAVGAGLDDSVIHMRFAPNADLYVAGSFHDVAGGGATLNHVGKWTAAGAWAALGATGVDDVARSIAITTNGNVYFGGDFHNAAGLSASHVAMWNGTWTALGVGTDNVVRSICVAPNGDMYATGDFHNAGGLAVAHIAKWNGVAWSALGTGLNNVGWRTYASPTGDIYVSGEFTTAGGTVMPSWYAVWSGGIWLPGLTGTLDAWPLDFYDETGRIIIAGAFTVASSPGVTHITTVGSARAYPVIAITGPGRLFYLINYTTNQVIYFDITLVASEILTIDLTPGVKTVTSLFRGNLISGVLAGALVNWYLAPGDNYIGCYVDDPTAAGTYTYTPMYWGID